MDEKDQINNLHSILKRLLTPRKWNELLWEVFPKKRHQLESKTWKMQASWLLGKFTHIMINYTLITKYWSYNNYDYNNYSLSLLESSKRWRSCTVKQNVAVRTMSCQTIWEKARFISRNLWYWEDETSNHVSRKQSDKILLLYLLSSSQQGKNPPKSSPI